MFVSESKVVEAAEEAEIDPHPTFPLASVVNAFEPLQLLSVEIVNPPTFEMIPARVDVEVVAVSVPVTRLPIVELAEANKVEVP